MSLKLKGLHSRRIYEEKPLDLMNGCEVEIPEEAMANLRAEVLAMINVLSECDPSSKWLGVRDDFRNWVIRAA